MLVALYVVWLCRQRLVKHIPSKETLNIFSLVALVVLLVGIGLLPDILILIASVDLMPPFLKTMLGLFAAAGIIYVGCSKKAETPKQPAIQWTSPETGFHAETPSEPKEGQ